MRRGPTAREPELRGRAIVIQPPRPRLIWLCIEAAAGVGSVIAGLLLQAQRLRDSAALPPVKGAYRDQDSETARQSGPLRGTGSARQGPHRAQHLSVAGTVV